MNRFFDELIVFLYGPAMLVAVMVIAGAPTWAWLSAGWMFWAWCSERFRKGILT